MTTLASALRSIQRMRRARIRDALRECKRPRRTRLSPLAVRVSRELNAAGITTRRLGKAFGVDHTTVWLAIRSYPVLRANGKVERRYYTWDHVR